MSFFGNENELSDYAGVKIGAMLIPLFLLFILFGKADVGLTVFIVFGVILVAIKLRWRLRKYIWFWAIIALVAAVHVPLFLLVRWPQGSTPTLFYTMPFGILDFVIISGILSVAEKSILE